MTDPALSPALSSPTVRRALRHLWPLLDVGAVVGAEQPLLHHLAEFGHQIGATVRHSDGVVELHNEDVPPGPILSVHADRHGLIALGDGTFGYAAHVRRADIEDEPTHATRAFLGRVADRFDGEEMFAYDPVTGTEIGRAEVEHVTDVRGGLVVRIDDLEDLPAGTPVAYAAPPTDERIVDEVVAGQLDNAVAIAVAMVLLDDGVASRVMFTREEEIGYSADHVLAHLERHESWAPLLVLDTSPFPTDQQARNASVVLRTRDATGSFDPATVAHLARTADALGIDVVLKDAWIEAANHEREANGIKPLGLGRTELGRIVENSGGRVTGGTVQVPTWDYHTARESTTTFAIKAFGDLIRETLRTWPVSDGPRAPRPPSPE